MDIGLWGWIKYLLGIKQLKIYYKYIDDISNKKDTQHFKNMRYWFPEYLPFDKKM